jgi:hypothetical protein
MAEREGLLPFKLIEDETGEALTSYKEPVGYACGKYLSFDRGGGCATVRFQGVGMKR